MINGLCFYCVDDIIGCIGVSMPSCDNCDHVSCLNLDHWEFITIVLLGLGLFSK